MYLQYISFFHTDNVLTCITRVYFPVPICMYFIVEIVKKNKGCVKYAYQKVCNVACNTRSVHMALHVW